MALGATAALSVAGREFAIQIERGRLRPLAVEPQMLVSVHPSYLLRIPEESQSEEYRRFVHDLRLVA